MADSKQHPTTAIVALAGRRIDAEGAEQPRFPRDNVEIVRRRIAEALGTTGAIALVCSAACGADLVALEAAEQLGLRRRIVLPFARDLFRKKSVTDREEEWGPVFDRQIAVAAAAGDLVVLGLEGDDDEAYAAANEAIIREALALGGAHGRPGAHRMIAMLVWEGARRQGSDATAGFGDLARKAGLEECSVSTV